MSKTSSQRVSKANWGLLQREIGERTALPESQAPVDDGAWQAEGLAPLQALLLLQGLPARRQGRQTNCG